MKDGKYKYILPMIAYPSGKLHMGHLRVYSALNLYNNFLKNIKKNETFFPMGWDAFGSPAEDAASLHGVDPEKWTLDNISEMKAVLLKLDMTFDWDHEVSTCSEEYSRFEQLIFVELYDKGLIYEDHTILKWDPVEKTFLSNEQCINGRGWRTNAKIEIKLGKAWFFKTGAFKESLMDGFKDIRWPEEVIKQQSYMLGKRPFETYYVNGYKILYNPKLNEELWVNSYSPDLRRMFDLRKL